MTPSLASTRARGFSRLTRLQQPTHARARDLQADALDDDIAGVVEEIRNGTLDANAGRVIVWAHQWRAAKMRPKRYGDKIDHKHSGSLVIGIRQNERVGDE